MRWIWLLLGASCAEAEPPSCVEIECNAAVSSPDDRWEACGQRVVTCARPDRPVERCRIGPREDGLCVCRFADVVTTICRSGE